MARQRVRFSLEESRFARINIRKKVYLTCFVDGLTRTIVAMAMKVANSERSLLYLPQRFALLGRGCAARYGVPETSCKTIERCSSINELA